MRLLAARELDGVVELDVERGPIRLTFDNRDGWGAVVPCGTRFRAVPGCATKLQQMADDLFGQGVPVGERCSAI